MADLTCVHCGSELHRSSRCPYVTDIPLDALARLAEYRDWPTTHAGRLATVDDRDAALELLGVSVSTKDEP